MSEQSHLLDDRRLPADAALPADRQPTHLWIGCTEHHAAALALAGLAPEEVWVHTNLANQFAPNDLGTLSVVQYAVDVLQVRHVIVCGHHGCRGIEAAAALAPAASVAAWLAPVRHLRAQHADELTMLGSARERADRLCALNAAAQVRKLRQSAVVRGARARGQSLSLQALVYDEDSRTLRDVTPSDAGDGAPTDGAPAADAAPVPGTDVRNGTLIVGAGPTARVLARVLARSGPVWLVDRNAEHCAHAAGDDLHAVCGNALDEQVLTHAHAAHARTFIAMTANAEINALAVRLAHDVFSIPEIHIHGAEDADAQATLADRFGTTPLFGRAVDLASWDHHVAHDEAATVGWAVRRPHSPARILREVGGPVPAFPLAIARGDRYLPFHGRSVLQAEDRLILLRRHTAPTRAYDRFDRLVWKAIVLDIDQPLEAPAFFQMAAAALAPAVDLSEEDLSVRFADREATGSTVILPGLAVPHVLLEGEGRFAMLMARCRGGVAFPGQAERVHMLFVLAGTLDQRNQHLRVLAAIANLAQWADFEPRWIEAADAEALRDLVINAPRRRLPETSAD